MRHMASQVLCYNHNSRELLVHWLQLDEYQRAMLVNGLVESGVCNWDEILSRLVEFAAEQGIENPDQLLLVVLGLNVLRLENGEVENPAWNVELQQMLDSCRQRIEEIFAEPEESMNPIVDKSDKQPDPFGEEIEEIRFRIETLCADILL